MEELQCRQLLELARASCASFAAHVKYRELHLKEFEIMHAIALDEYEEAESMLKDAEWQVGEVKSDITDLECIGHISESLGVSGLFSKHGDGLPDNLDNNFDHAIISPTPSCGSSMHS